MLLLLALACSPVSSLAPGVTVRDGAATIEAADGHAVTLATGQGAPVVVPCAAPCEARVEAPDGDRRWYWEARAAGVEFGVVVETPADALRLPVRVEGATPRALGRDHVRLDTPGAPLHVRGIRAFDADGARLFARMAVEGDALVLHVDTRGARFPVDVDPLVSADAVGGASGSELVAIGDVDGDGFDDLAVGDGSTLYEGEVHVLRGGSPGPDLAPAWTLTDTSGGDYARALGGGDFDGDGYADLAILRYHMAAEVIVDVHAGSPSGPSATPVTVIDDDAGNADQQGDLAVHDLDADGYDDLVLLRSDCTAVDVYPGGAAGLATTPSTSVTLPEAATAVLPADLDGDGLVDLVVAARRSMGVESREGVVWVYLGTAGGYLASPSWTYRRSGESHAECGTGLAVGDLDADGRPELAIGCPGYTDTVSDVGIVDLFDGEDLAAGPVTSIAGTTQGDSYGADVEGGDLDGDGDEDLVIGGWASGSHRGIVGLWWNDGGTLVAGDRVDVESHVEGVGRAIAVADQNGDGIADLAVATGESDGWGFSGVSWWWPGATEGIALTDDPPDWRAWLDATGLGSAAAGDFDGDGHAELAISDDEDRILTVSDAATTTAFDGEAGDYGTTVVAADVDGDGLSDLVVASGSGASSGSAWPNAQLFVHRGTAAGLEETPATGLVPITEGWGNPLALGALGDVDGDGFEDVGYADSFLGLGEGTLNVLFGGAGFGTRTQVLTPDVTEGSFGDAIAPAGDVNGDGYADVLVAAPNASVSFPGAGHVALYLGGAAGLDATPAWTVDGDAANAFLRMPSTGDVDGDGALDVMVVAPGSRRASLHLGDGLTFAAGAAWTDGDAWTGTILPDLDGDGDAEVAITRRVAGDAETLTIYAGTPLGPGGPLHAFAQDGAGTDCLDAPRGADLDGDGTSELVLVCSGGARVEVWTGGPDPDDADGDGWDVDEDCDDADATVGACEPVDTGTPDSGDSGGPGETGETGAPDTADSADTADTADSDDAADSGTAGETGRDDTGGKPPDGCGSGTSGGGCATGGRASVVGLLLVLAGLRRRARAG